MSIGGVRILESSLSDSARETWEIVPFSDVVYFQEGPGIRHWQYSDSGIPFVNIRCLVDGRLNVNAMSHISEIEVNAKYRHFLLDENDFVISSSGTIGRLAEVRSEDLPCLLNTSVIRMRPLNDRIDRGYLKQFLLSRLFQSQIEMWAAGSAQVNYGPSHLKQMSISIPPLEEQRAIAHVLGALDDKIELNRKMNETLEEIARTIFTSWFVNFDPVRAKAEGRQPEGMDAETAALFPESFVDSELGEIPNGWEIASLGDIALVVDCLHSKKPERKDTGLPLIQLSNIRSDGLLDLGDTYFISKEDYDRWIARMEASEGDCVITNVGRVGAVSQVPEGVRAAMGRNMTGIRCQPSFPFPSFLITCLLSDAMRAEIAQRTDSGTILDALNVKNIPRLRFVKASRSSVELFEETCRPLRARMEHNLRESRTLSEIRDTLLPRLLSGEIRIPAAEKILAEVSV